LTSAARAPAHEALVRRRWLMTALLSVAGLINYFDRTIVSVALPVIAADLNLRPAKLGVLLSAFFWSYALMQVPIGWLSDRFNLRWLYAGCFALWSLTCGFTGFAASLGVLILLRMLLGLGESIYLPGAIKMVSVTFPASDRGFASGLVNFGTRAGLAFGAPLIAGLVTRFGWRRSFFILGFTALVWLVPWLASFPRGASSASLPGSRARRLVGHVNRNLLGMSIANIGYGYYFYLMVTWLPSYLVNTRHLTLQAAGRYAVLPYLIFAIGEPVGGWIADQLVRAGWEEVTSRKVIIAAAYLSSILLIPAGLARDNHSALLLLGGASLVGLSTANIYAVAAPLITGLIIDRTGSYFPAFVVAVAALLAVLPVYWRMVKA